LDLQAKLKTYLAFIEEGQLAAMYPAFARKRIRIRLDTAYPLGAMDIEFLQRANDEWLRPLRIECEVGDLNVSGIDIITPTIYRPASQPL